MDVIDQKTIDELRRWTEERFNKLDVLVNNAAILYDDWQRVGSADLNVVKEAFETNTLGAWRMPQALFY